MKLWKRRIGIAAAYALILGGFLLGALAGSRVVTTAADARRQSRRQTVIIDPGHGGEDGGATSCTGIPESRINL